MSLKDDSPYTATLHHGTTEVWKHTHYLVAAFVSADTAAAAAAPAVAAAAAGLVPAEVGRQTEQVWRKKEKKMLFGAA